MIREENQGRAWVNYTLITGVNSHTLMDDLTPRHKVSPEIADLERRWMVLVRSASSCAQHIACGPKQGRQMVQSLCFQLQRLWEGISLNSEHIVSNSHDFEILLIWSYSMFMYLFYLFTLNHLDLRMFVDYFVFISLVWPLWILLFQPNKHPFFLMYDTFSQYFCGERTFI